MRLRPRARTSAASTLCSRQHRWEPTGGTGASQIANQPSSRSVGWYHASEGASERVCRQRRAGAEAPRRVCMCIYSRKFLNECASVQGEVGACQASQARVSSDVHSFSKPLIHPFTSYASLQALDLPVSSVVLDRLGPYVSYRPLTNSLRSLLQYRICGAHVTQQASTRLAGESAGP